MDRIQTNRSVLKEKAYELAFLSSNGDLHSGPCACVGIGGGCTDCPQWWNMVLERAESIGGWFHDAQAYKRTEEYLEEFAPIIQNPGPMSGVGRTAGLHPEPELKYAIVLKDLGPNRIKVLKAIRVSSGRSLPEIMKMKDNLPHTFTFSNWTIAEMFRKTMEALKADIEFYQLED